MKRVLIVEDSLTQAEHLRFILEENGFSVEAASDARRALHLLATSSYDIVISDIVMPGLSGYELCREIKANPGGAEIPVILLTSLNDPMDIIRGLECGADNFLTKPYEPDQLVARVRAAIDNKTLRGQSRLKLGVDVLFLGQSFTITSDKEQILDLLISTFEDIVRTNRSLRESEAELSAAKAQIEEHAYKLEEQVRIRTDELAQANESLRQSNELLKAIITSSPLAIYLLDADGKVTMWNAAAEQVFGYTEREAVGQFPPFVTPQNLDEFRLHISSILSSSSISGMEFSYRHKSGSSIDVNVSWAPIRDGSGDPCGIMHIAMDVTAQKALHAQLSHAHKMEAVGQLTGGVAHDFNNMLSVIVGCLDLLEEQFGSNREVAKLTDTALQASLRGATLTRQLLAFSRRQPLKHETIEMNALVSGMTELLARILDERVQVKLVAAPDQIYVTSDPAQIESALTNLAVNARHAMPDGGLLTIQVTRACLDAEYARENPDATPGEYVCLDVTDTGTGIPPEILSRVFEPFFTTKRAGEGTGLGLSQVYGFVKQTGGHIKIYSEPGFGTTVRMYLPTAKSPDTAMPKVEEIINGGKLGGSEAILVVEDNEFVRNTVVGQLSSLGYRTVEADNVASALGVLGRGEHIDLLFTDVVMPGGLSGIDLAREVAKRHPAIKILMSSGFPGMAISRNAELPHEVRFLSKPYRRQELAEVVREMLEHRR